MGPSGYCIAEVYIVQKVDALTGLQVHFHILYCTLFHPPTPVCKLANFINQREEKQKRHRNVLPRSKATEEKEMKVILELSVYEFPRLQDYVQFFQENSLAKYNGLDLRVFTCVLFSLHTLN